MRAHAGFAYGAIGADIHVFGDGTPVYLLYVRDARSAALRDAPATLRAQPSRLLDARAETVEFTGRTTELAALRVWRDQPAATAVRWLHGPGGAGKSRLAARFAAECADDGWLVVDAVHGTDGHQPAEGSQDLRTGGRPGVLVLVDYADRWPHDHLCWLLRNTLLDGSPPARVLFTGRSVRPWPALRAQLNRRRRAVDLSDQPLAPLSAGSGERLGMYEAARRGFAAHYPDPAALSEIPAPADLGHTDFGLTLAVHMAALVAVDARAGSRAAPADLAGMTTYLLDREHDNWRHPSAGGPGPGGNTDTDLARTVYTAVLTGPQPRARALSLLARLVPRAPHERLLADHAVYYPAPGTGAHADHVLQPLLPDRLAEDYLALSLPGSPVSGHPTDPWTVTATTRVLERDGGAAPAWTPRALAFLTAAAERWPHVGERVLFPLLRRDPALAVRAGGTLLTQLAALDTIDPGVLEAVGSVAGSSDVRVRTGAGNIAGRLAAQRLTETEDPLEQARLTREIAGAHLSAGRREAALERAEEAVRLARRAAGQEPVAVAAFEELAEALALLGGEYVEEVGHARAAALLREAIGLYEEAGAGSTASGAAALGCTHTRLALALWGAGEREAAFTAVTAAEERYEALQRLDPPAWVSKLSRLAELAQVHAMMLHGSGHLARSAELAELAVEYSRASARLSPARHGDRLAGHLAMLARHLWDAGRRDDSVTAALEAVHLYRQVARAVPARRRLLLAALDNAADRLAARERHDEAEALVEEALALRRELLAEAAPGTAPDTAAVARARRYLRERQGERRLPWGTAEEIEEAARDLAERDRAAELRELVRSVPVADAVRLALRHRRPLLRDAPEDDQDVLRRLAALSPRDAARGAREAADRTRWRLPYQDAPPQQRGLSFAVGAPLLAWAPTTDRVRIDVLDIEGRSVRWTAGGRGFHGDGPVVCLGPEALLAVRTAGPGATAARPELVRYQPDGRAEVLTGGPRLVDARAVATARGYAVVLRRGRPTALVGTAAGPPREVDLYRLGVYDRPAIACDPTGERLVLAGGRALLCTDADLVPLGRESRPWLLPEDLGEVREVVFAGPDTLVIAVSSGGLYLMEATPDLGGLIPMLWTAPAPPLTDLAPVPAWRALASRMATPTTWRSWHDTIGLGYVSAPRPVVEASGGDRVLTTVAASADGRYALHGGPVPSAGALLGRRPHHQSVLHDLGDPAGWVNRPVASFTPAELAALDTYLASDRAPCRRVRELLDLARALAGHRHAPGRVR